MPRTEYLYGDDAAAFLQSGYCDHCLQPAKDWAEQDRIGGVEVYAAEDCSGDLVGFLCPDCGKGGTERGFCK